MENVEAESVENFEVQQVLEIVKEAPIIEGCEESDWETVKDCDNGSESNFPAIDTSCDNWAVKYTESIMKFHSKGHIIHCENCNGVFTPEHQC